MNLKYFELYRAIFLVYHSQYQSILIYRSTEQLKYKKRKINKKMSSDSNPTMLAKKIFDQIIQQVQSSNLNFQLHLSPFSATISLKKSFVRDKLGNILLPSINVTESELQMQENNLISESENVRHLKVKILEVEENNKSKDNTIKTLEEKLCKSEASASRSFSDKNDEVRILKTSLKNANKELDNLKNDLKSRREKVKETEKELYKLDQKCNMSEAKLKKCMEETNVLKSENKKLLNKLNRKRKKDFEKSINDENDNSPDDISSQMQESASDLPSLLLSPGRKYPSSSTDPPSSTLTLSPLFATPISNKSAASAIAASVSPKTPPTSPSCTTPDWDASGSSSAMLPEINDEAHNLEPIATVQAKLKEVRDSGKKLDYESLVVLLKKHPWEESHQQIENDFEYDPFDYDTYPDEYEETMNYEENDEP